MSNNSEHTPIIEDYVLNTDGSSYCVRLIISDAPPPKEVDSNEFDFLVQVHCEEEELNNVVLQIIDRARKNLLKNGEKNPDGEMAYKARINTDKLFENTSVFIRDEQKDEIPYLQGAALLNRLLGKIFEESDQYYEEENDDDDDKISYSEDE